MDALEADVLAAAIGKAVGDIEHVIIKAGGVAPRGVNHVPGARDSSQKDGQRDGQGHRRDHEEDEGRKQDDRGRVQGGRGQGTRDGDFGDEDVVFPLGQLFLSWPLFNWLLSRLTVDSGEDFGAQGLGIALCQEGDFDGRRLPAGRFHAHGREPKEAGDNGLDDVYSLRAVIACRALLLRNNPAAQGEFLLAQLVAHLAPPHARDEPDHRAHCDEPGQREANIAQVCRTVFPGNEGKDSAQRLHIDV